MCGSLAYDKPGGCARWGPRPSSGEARAEIIGVGQQVQAAHLYPRSGVADPGDGGLPRCTGARIDLDGCHIGRHLRRGLLRRGWKAQQRRLRLPLQQLAQAFGLGIETVVVQTTVAMLHWRGA